VTTETADHNQPPRKRQATKLDYDSDTSSDTPSLTTATTSTTDNSTASTIPNAPLPSTITADLLSLKTALTDLRTVIMAAVEQIKSAVASLLAPCIQSSGDMETEDAHPPTTYHSHQTHLEIQMDADQSPTATKSDISDFIADLKQDIATIAIEMQAIVDLKSDIALIKSHPLFCNLQPINQQILVT